MMIFEVTFDYFSDGESGNDKFSFADKDEATTKFHEHKEAIKQEFGNCANTDRINEEDTFGIMDCDSGSWARVSIVTKTK